MARESNEIEQVVARTVRDSLEKLQRSTEELNQAVNDLVSSCASTRPSNTLPPMMRAQTAAASLSVSLEVLSRFVASSLQQMSRPMIDAAVDADSEPPAAAEPKPQVERPMPAVAPVAAQHQAEPVLPKPVPPQPIPVHRVAPTVAPLPASDSVEVDVPVYAEPEAALPPVQQFESMPVPTLEPLQQPVTDDLPLAATFDPSTLSVEEQELHRRANRVAKVSMQDIKLLRPNDVQVGREQKDLCVRLRDDIEKANREYDRRFQSIMGHPVDYFYDWMVEILGEGKPENLGEYPYPSPVLRH